MTSLGAVLLSLIFSAAAANAATLTENFADRAHMDTATAVWNHALGKVHPKIQVINYEPGFVPITVDIGDGSHGEFAPATYASFSAGGDISGNKIRLDTTAFPILKVTSFRLEAGWTLEPTGPNPLVIYSMSDVIIEGSIDCKGADGGNATNLVPGTGGIGRCGGGSGGDGGTTGTSGNDGLSLLAPVTAGSAGTFNAGVNTPGVGGGGGGTWNTSTAATAGNPVAGFGGDPGTSITDPEFFDITPGASGGGGAGGGGGAASNMAGGKPGAGGGAGGGAVIIHTVRDFSLGAAPVSAFGTINVNGGIGGGTGHQGGAGGGGGGGSVKVFAGGKINLFNNSGLGASRANGGLGGTNLLSNNGGNGGMGRSWYASNVYNDVGTGFYTPFEDSPVYDPFPVPYDGQIVQFIPTSQNVISKVFDLQSNFTEIQSIQLSPVSAEFTFEAAGSSDNFVSDDTGFTQNVNLLSGKRYLKFRITLSGGDVSLPDMVDEASIVYLAGQREEFNLQSAGCGRIIAPPPGPGGGTFFVLIFGFLALLKFKAQRRKAVRAE